jgi:hypothetical protein
MSVENEYNWITDFVRKLGRELAAVREQRDRLAEVAVLATQLDTSQTCDPDHHTLVVMAIKALQPLTPNAEL